MHLLIIRKLKIKKINFIKIKNVRKCENSNG